MQHNGKHQLPLLQVACLGRCNGAEVQCHSHTSASEAQFREAVWEACKGQSWHLIVSYSRKVLLQTGEGGHAGSVPGLGMTAFAASHYSQSHVNR